ncbi:MULTISPECIES: helix-turn-helix domain-containing protein [Niastella]|uniref:Helix-turn-helix domain-containing protein n=1 Tax=Niastella soli TaxID=2821487 RepID=A0ABS3YVG5_9BACT|nr:helix-turn-helix domain-containing protein [Niastella soli]MBO9201400.1 helix-turn-helix domain-containing protein [Niastella soli]
MLENINPYTKYVLDAIRCIKQQLDEKPLQYKTASELLEKICAPNRNAVEKAFKANFGAGIKEYQVRQRLEASKKFLEQGLTKKQVAGKCFYRSQSAYAAAFRKEFGMTPTTWQMLYG